MFVIPDITNTYFAALAKGIDDIAEMYKYNIVLANSDEDDEKEVSVVNTSSQNRLMVSSFMGYHLTEKNPFRILTFTNACSFGRNCGCRASTSER